MNASPEKLAGERLPELTDDRIDEIERALFADIAATRTRSRARRGRIWIGAGAAAAVIVVAAVIAPSVGSLVSPTFQAADGAAVSPEMAPGVDMSGGGELSSGARDEGVATGYAAGEDSATAGREIIATASASMTVDDAAAAAQQIADDAIARGGYVESMSIDGANSQRYAEDGVYYEMMPYPGSSSWITVRIPADELQPAIAALDDVGEVTSSQITRQDVTEQTGDLRARIDAAQASVDRLTELMSEATSTADLIAAESALADRQAMLESYQQELNSLESMVALSSLTVSLTEPAEIVEADPAGFADGLAAGWNGLVATLNGIVIAIGFLIPWIAVAAVAWLVVWGVIRLVRRRRRARDHAEKEDASTEA